ncbi:MAG: glycosyltransferase [Bacillota bacterium]
MKPKVLQVITDTNIGGAGRYLLYLLRQPAMEAFSISVACPGGLLKCEFDSLGVKTLGLHQGDRSASLSNLLQVSGFLKDGYHIIHTHSSIAARIAGRFSGATLIVTKHGLEAPARGLLGKAASRLAGVFLADRYIAVSEAVAAALARQGVPESKVTVIHNGIEPPPCSVRSMGESLREELGVFTVGMVARMSPEKDYDTFFKAASLVSSVIPSARFLAVGDGPQRPRLEGLVRDLGMAGRVTFTGHVRDIWGVLGALDIMVLSSRHEGLGLAALEAMACGVPVVASSVGGLTEVITHGETGLLFPAGSPGDLADALRYLAQDPDQARRIGQAAKDSVISRFSASKMAEETAAIYRRHLR